jgi:hypothetical protein
MSVPIPQALQDDRWKAYIAVVDILRNDPRLRDTDVVRTWAVWDGSNSVDDPPTDAKAPWVRLTPTFADMTPAFGWGDRTFSRADVEIKVEIATGGKHPAPMMYLWGRIVRALHPPAEDRDRRVGVENRLDAAGISRLEMQAPAIAVNDSGGPVITATGSIHLEMYVQA